MMTMNKTVRINGVDETLPEGRHLFEDFIDGLAQKLGAERKVIARIRIDGKELDNGDEAEGEQRLLLASLGEIEIETASPADLAYQTLDTLEQYVDRIVGSIQRAAMHYRGKNLLSADEYFAKAIDGLDLFVQTIGGVKLALRIGLNTQLALTEAELISIMNDLLDAKRQNNYVYMSQLLDKELVENLLEWKTSIFPLLRQLRSV